MNKGEQLEKIVTDFVAEQRITCAETIYQSDRVIENAYDLIAKLCNVVGYKPEDPEDYDE